VRGSRSQARQQFLKFFHSFILNSKKYHLSFVFKTSGLPRRKTGINHTYYASFHR
jgi:hypothetical protein